MDNNKEVLLSLVSAGLWEKDVQPLRHAEVDYANVLMMAEAQGVVGLVTAGINTVHGSGFMVHGSPLVPKPIALRFIGRAMQIEHQNREMNRFIGVLMEKMRKAGIKALLVKGQGVAQCYERPLWRPSGDVDLLLDKENYERTKALLLPLSSSHKPEELYSLHLGIDIDSWYVEIHGSLRTGLSTRVDRVVDNVVHDALSMENGNFRKGTRVWNNGNTRVYLPAPTEDVFLVFTHFIKHLYKEGISLRQVCDWCRLLWTYREEIDTTRLESWVHRAGLMQEWQAFATLAVTHLGMPVEAMPMFGSKVQGSGFRVQGSGLMVQGSGFRVLGERLVEFILGGYSGKKVKDTWRIAKIFPKNTVKFLPSIFLNVNGMKMKERIKGLRD